MLPPGGTVQSVWRGVTPGSGVTSGRIEADGDRFLLDAAAAEALVGARLDRGGKVGRQRYP